MRFIETKLQGAYILEIEPIVDERGFFARTFCVHEFEAHGLNTQVAQCNISSNKRKGTLRGMHYQAAPHAETKLVQCVRGAIYDVIVDLRTDSPTFKSWFAVELTSTNHRMLYVPEGFAHGFQTLEDDSEVLYQISEFYHPQSVRGLLWNDPSLSIEWPLEVTIISTRDQSYAAIDA